MTNSARQLMDALTAARVAEGTAAAWVHSGALLAHAAATGMLNQPAGDVRGGLERLADAWPQLKSLIDPAINPAMAADIPRDLAAACTTQAPPLDATPEREFGYALGDLYQDLSTESRKRRALCQTPWWVTRLLLDLAYDPAYEQWGTATRVADPACGTGHILVETMLRAHLRLRMGLCRSSRDTSPRLPPRSGAEDKTAHALASVAGVDLDPYAAAVARYRLLCTAVMILRGNRAADPAGAVRAMPVQVAAANSLLDGSEPLLARGQYHAVLANPPYITPKDKQTRDAVRAAWPQACHRQYALSVAFEPLMHALCAPGGWVARLTANSFMKREFGQRLIEDYFPGVDLRWIIDTSGAYIPGHGTPTCILVSRNQRPTSDTVSTVLGIRGEPRIPEDPSRGVVWSAITAAVGERLAYQRLARGVERAANRDLPPPPEQGESAQEEPAVRVVEEPGGQLAFDVGDAA